MVLDQPEDLPDPIDADTPVTAETAADLPDGPVDAETTDDSMEDLEHSWDLDEPDHPHDQPEPAADDDPEVVALRAAGQE